MQALTPHLRKFSAAYDFLQKDLPRLSVSDPPMWRAFLKHARLSESDGLAAVTMNGTPPLLFAQNLGLFTWAQFDPQIPDRIELNREVLTQFGNDSANSEAHKFLRAKALHEMCHWGCFRKNVPDPDTAGESFEAEVMGGELQPWWLNTGATLAPANPQIFTDAASRAQLLQSFLTKSGHVAGRENDPTLKTFGGVDVAEGMPRGYRNNNPGNIRTGDSWLGLAESTEQTEFQRRESAFCVFREPEWGLRAIARLLRRYKNQHGLKTPRKIIERWAPTSDGNNVEAYSGQLAKALGVTRDATIDVDDEPTVIAMMKAIATHENGARPPYTHVQFQAAVRLA